MSSRNLFQRVMKYSTQVAVAGSLSLSQMSCAPVPDSVKKKMKWEIKEDQNADVYEQSLREEYIGGKNNDPKNLWRVLNYVMYYLGTEKSKGMHGSQTRDELQKLRPLNVVYDSAQIESIYNKVFASENTNFGEGGNSFIEDVKKRTEQIIEYKGFDPFGRLNELGQYIARLGKFRLENKDDGYIIVQFPTGKHYKFVESESFDWILDKVSIVPISPLDNARNAFGDIQTPGDSRDSKLESGLLKIEDSYKVFVPVGDSAELGVREIKVTKFPVPSRGNYFTDSWDSERFVIDISANFEGFKTRDSAGKKLMAFDLEYIVSELRSSASGGDSLVRVGSGKKSFNYEVSRAEKKDGFQERVDTDMFPTNKNYQIDVKVTNAGRPKVGTFVIKTAKSDYPLEIVRKEEKIIFGQQTSVPHFHVGPVKGDSLVDIFFTLSGLDKDNAGFYSGRAFVSLVEPRKKGGRVVTGKLEAGILGDTLSTGRTPPVSRYEDIKTGTEKFRIATIDIASKTPNGMFSYKIKIPNSLSKIKNFLIEFYTKDEKKGIVKSIGTASKEIQIK